MTCLKLESIKSFPPLGGIIFTQSGWWLYLSLSDKSFCKNDSLLVSSSQKHAGSS